MNQPESPSTPTPAPPATEHQPSRAPSSPAGFGLAILSALLAAQLCLGWMHGRMLNRQHGQLLELREDLQGLAEAIEHSYSEGAEEEGSLAPALEDRSSRGTARPHPSHRTSHRTPDRKRLLRVRSAIQTEPPPEQDPAAKELEVARKSGEKAVKDAKVAQKQLSFQHAAKKAERNEKIDSASKKFFWATIGAAVVLIGAFAARGFIRRQRG